MELTAGLAVGLRLINQWPAMRVNGEDIATIAEAVVDDANGRLISNANNKVHSSLTTSGRIVLNACRRENLKVPDRIAVIGVDNDEVLCDLSSPPLSSVNPPCERIGYEAAALLDRLMRKEKVAGKLLLDPLGVVDRDSTAVLATTDQMVVDSLAFIRNHYLEGVHVRHILKHLKSLGTTVSRSTMERRFFNIVGHSPRDEIQRLRLDKTRELLLGTNLPLNQISAMVGFEHHEYLCAVFKRETGQTPGDYRRQLGRFESVDRSADPTASAV